MKPEYFLCVMLVCAAALSQEGASRISPISRHDAETLTRWLLPLPKELKFLGIADVPIDELFVRTDESPSELIQCAAKELNERLGTQRRDKRLAVLIGVKSSPMFRDLRDIPDIESVRNADQAYAILPVPSAGGGSIRGIALIGRTEVGAYYAAKTFMQLLDGAQALASSGGAKGVPIARIRDFPDLEERGEWGGSANEDVEWFADMKMNLVESHCRYGYDEDGKVFAEVDQELVRRCRTHAVRFVAIVSHLDQLASRGIFRKYPEVKGVRASDRLAETLFPVCWSKPNAWKAIADWVCAVASQPGVEYINLWLSECSGTQCACPECKKTSQYEMEAKVAVAAYRAAQKVNPRLKFRILLTQGSYNTNDKVLAVVPRDVGITYYSGSATYNSNQEPMIYPLLEKYAAEGGWLGCYPQLTASWRIVSPWSCPQFIRFRMNEFVQKKLRCLCGYATPSNRFYDFNVTAAAEWSWNSTGRNEREFAIAWATRRRLPQPGKVADWAVTLGPVGWDIYGAHVPYPWFFGSVAAYLRKGALPPLGEEPFKYIKTEEEMEQNLAACERAMKLAREIGAPALIYETQTITGYMKMLKTLHQLSLLIAKKKSLNEDEKQRAAGMMKELDAATDAVVEGLKKWKEAVAPDIYTSRFLDTIRYTEQTTADVSSVLVRLGVRDEKFPYRPHRIGAWKTKDFAAGADIRKQWDVSFYITEPGRYRVRFLYEKGWYGLRINRVALAAADPKAPDKLVEVAVDDHVGSTGHHPKNEIYILELKKYDPNLKYFILADVHGRPPDAPEERRGCNGTVMMRKLPD